MLTAIIVAAGSSRRMGFDKLAVPIAGRSVLARSVEAFQNAESVSEIVVVVHPDRFNSAAAELKPFSKVIAVIPGGKHRQDSVAAGLRRVGAQARYVAVHDGARPLVTPADIERVFAAASRTRAATLAIPVTDTLKRTDKNLIVTESVDRERLFAMQTPQIFEKELLENAYRAVMEEGLHITDEVSAVERLGHAVTVVLGEQVNLKITYERDLRLAEWILADRSG